MDYAPVIARHRAFFDGGKTRSLDFRRAALTRLEQALESREAQIYTALRADLRKSADEAYLTELGLVLSEVRYARRHLPKWMKAERRGTPLMAWPGRSFIQPEPYGVALIIGPWNYPLQLLLSPLVGAIAAGNCAVLKPSELAPNTSAAIEELVRSALDADHVSVIPGERGTAEALLRERFDSIFFTGGGVAGRAVMSAAARHLTPVTLELGGKSPCVVCADAPLTTTARRIVWGKFMNAGQTCVAPDFVLVERAVRDGLIAAMQAALREFYGPNPQSSAAYSRIINRRHFERLIAYLPDGQIAHGGQHDAGDLYLAPTLLTGTPWDASVMRDEIFGPILPVLEFDDLNETLVRLREHPAPLALYLFTTNRATQDRVLAETRSGGVCLNDVVVHMVGKEMPFGGLGESGLGAYHGKASFDCFSHRRAVLRRSFRFDSPLRYPPPRVTLRTLKRAYRYLLGG